MPTLSDTRLAELHSQHSIQSQDLLEIFNLAKAEDVVNDIETHSFDDFLGLTIHLFVTTQSQHTREQLSLQLPKFGSVVVLPLIKILCRIQTHKDIHALAQQGLARMELYPLIIGLSQVLDQEADKALRTAAMDWLMQLIQENNQSFLSVLPALVSPKTLRLLQLRLLETMPYFSFNTECHSKKKSHKGENLTLCKVQ